MHSVEDYEQKKVSNEHKQDIDYSCSFSCSSLMFRARCRITVFRCVNREASNLFFEIWKISINDLYPNCSRRDLTVSHRLNPNRSRKVGQHYYSTLIYKRMLERLELMSLSNFVSLAFRQRTLRAVDLCNTGRMRLFS